MPKDEGFNVSGLTFSGSEKTRKSFSDSGSGVRMLLSVWSVHRGAAPIAKVVAEDCEAFPSIWKPPVELSPRERHSQGMPEKLVDPKQHALGSDFHGIFGSWNKRVFDSLISSTGIEEFFQAARPAGINQCKFGIAGAASNFSKNFSSSSKEHISSSVVLRA